MADPERSSSPGEPGGPDWLADERVRFGFVRELQRLKRRAKARPLPILLLAAALTALVVYRAATKPTIYKARVVLRVTEGALSEDRTPLPRKDLRDYVNNVSFSNRQLAEVVDDLDLFSSMRDLRGMDYAVAELRSGLRVNVYRNYFANDKGFSTAQRSARIAIAYAHTDPDVALLVAQRLARLIEETEQRRRTVESERMAAQADAAVEMARTRVREWMGKIARLELALDAALDAGDDAAAAQARYAIGQNQLRLESDRAKLDRVLAVQSAIDLRRSLEGRNMGLEFHVADTRPPVVSERAQWITLTAVGAAAVFVLLPLCAIGIGAFDSRVHDTDDARRLGFEVIGHVPAFRGDRVGSLAERRKSVQRENRIG